MALKSGFRPGYFINPAPQLHDLTGQWQLAGPRSRFHAPIERSASLESHFEKFRAWSLLILLRSKAMKLFFMGSGGEFDWVLFNNSGFLHDLPGFSRVDMAPIEF